MSGRRIPFYGDKLAKSPVDLAALPEPQAKPNPVDSLAAASEECLQNLMLSHMSMAANLRQNISDLIWELAEQIADAKLAEMLLAQKQRKRGNL